MKDAVVMKSYQNGITILLDEELPFEQLVEEIRLKFTQAKGFFGSASMALSFEGRHLTNEEEMRILEAIRSCSDVNVICIVGKDQETDKLYLKALHQVERKLGAGSEGQFYKGTLQNKEVLETESSIVILGDVHPGCTVISTRNIIVLGGLYGGAYAGGNGQDGHYVVALEMEPEKLKIGDFKYKNTGKQIKWGFRPKVQPKIAYIKNNRIVFEPLTKELLGTF